MSTRARILHVAAELVAGSTDGDVSTRAVCEAAQVGAPALYRYFGDKQGLLSAVVDHGFDAYLATKREHRPGADPVEDLRDGWDTHVDFAVRNPNLFRLMYSPAMRTTPAAAHEAHRILTRDLERAAARGRLRLAPALAAQIVMSANVGVALMLVTRPATYSDAALSRRVRDAVHAAVFTPDVVTPDRAAGLAPAAPAPAGAAGASPSPSVAGGAGAEADAAELPAAAARLGALLGRAPESVLTAAETALLTEWLERLANAVPRP